MLELGKIHLGDCLEHLGRMEDCSVDAIVTDPPYELGFMGKAWDKSGISYKVELWKEALRVLKPGGYLLAFGGSRTYHRITCAIEDAGFEIRDQIMWIYGSGFPKSLDVSKAIDKMKGGDSRAKQWDGWGTALKPAHEPICVARKPFDCTVAENVLEWGTGAINIDGCRVPAIGYTAGGKNLGIAFGRGDGATKQARCDGSKGRFPANIIHDGSEEVVEGFPNSKSTGGCGEKSRTWKSKGVTINGGCQATGGFGDSGSASRFFYCAKASTSERNAGCEDIERGNAHPTVKPIALMTYLVKLVSRDGATIYDPFTGSGTTAIACMRLGRNFIGSEKMPEHVEIANKRIEAERAQLKLAL